MLNGLVSKYSASIKGSVFLNQPKTLGCLCAELFNRKIEKTDQTKCCAPSGQWSSYFNMHFHLIGIIMSLGRELFSPPSPLCMLGLVFFVGELTLVVFLETFK